MRYVLPKQVSDVSDALHLLFTDDIAPRLRKQDSNNFRATHCYNEELDAVLARHLASLTVLFEEYAANTDVREKHLSRLLSFQEYLEMLRELNLIDFEFTSREATLAFVWSRMVVIDEENPKTKVKRFNFRIEDMFESFVRIAMMKALPTDDEIETFGCRDAGEMLLTLGESDDDLAEWVQEHPSVWGQAPRQPVPRMLHHLIMLIIRTIKKAVRGSDDSKLTRKEVVTYRNRASAVAGVSRLGPL